MTGACRGRDCSWAVKQGRRLCPDKMTSKGAESREQAAQQLIKHGAQPPGHKYQQDLLQVAQMQTGQPWTKFQSERDKPECFKSVLD